MKVDRKKAHLSERDGRTVYLCSEHCRVAFEADPGAYTAKAGKPRGEAAHSK